MTFDSTFHSRSPVVRVERASWLRIVDADGLGLRRAVAFEHEVSWLRQAHAKTVLVGASGRVIDEATTYCDAGAFLGCLEDAVALGARMADEEGIGAGPVRVEVRLDVSDDPVLPQPREAWDSDVTPPRWRPVPTDWIHGADLAVAEAWLALPGRERRVRPQPALRRLEPTPVLDGFVAWSTAGDRLGALGEALDRALAGLPGAFAGEVRARVAADVSAAASEVA